MRQILDEYGDAIIGVIAALLVIGVAVYLFSQGGIVDNLFTDIAGKAI